jgi:DNA-binding transcriptional LysR family regulator
MLNPIWLKTFITLVEQGHFTRTAEVLNMTQPGVSQHIAKLEDACGYPLLKRFNKQFELTVYGQKVYLYALQRLTEEEALLKDLGRDEPFKGKCTIGCSGTFAWLLYAPLLELQTEFPNLAIELEASPNQKILDHIQGGTLDIGLVTKAPNSKYFDYRQVGTQALVFVAPQGTDDDLPLPTLLPRLGVIRHPDLALYFQTYLARMANPSLLGLDLDRIPTKSYINQIHQILTPIAKGIGFTVIPKCCVDLFPEPEKLKILATDVDVSEPVYLVHKRNAPLASRYRIIVQHIETILAQFR